MNGWLIVGAAAVALVVVWRLWFRWFSRRPLSDTDSYAVAVDTDLDSAQGAPTLRPAAQPPSSRSSGSPTTADRSRPPTVRSVPGPAGRPVRRAAAPVVPDAPVIPRQRDADDPRVAGGPAPVSTGPDGAAVADDRRAGRGADRPAPLPPTG